MHAVQRHLSHSLVLVYVVVDEQKQRKLKQKLGMASRTNTEIGSSEDGYTDDPQTLRRERSGESRAASVYDDAVSIHTAGDEMRYGGDYSYDGSRTPSEVSDGEWQERQQAPPPPQEEQQEQQVAGSEQQPQPQQPPFVAPEQVAVEIGSGVVGSAGWAPPMGTRMPDYSGENDDEEDIGGFNSAPPSEDGDRDDGAQVPAASATAGGGQLRRPEEVLIPPVAAPDLDAPEPSLSSLGTEQVQAAQAAMLERPGMGEFANVPDGVHLTPPTDAQRAARAEQLRSSTFTGDGQHLLAQRLDVHFYF